MQLHTTPLKNVAIGIYDGPHATPKESDNGPIFLGIKNVTADGRLDLSEIRHVAEEDFAKWTRRVTPQKDDLVFSYEATLHLYARIPDNFLGCLGRRMALIRPDIEKIDPRFFHYYLLSAHWREKMEAITIVGATVNRIPLTLLPDVEVSIPDLATQTRIAYILSAYDDLIENNRRRIALLEQAARELYREWFVRLRFPGHEHVKIVDGVPDGWTRSSLSNAADDVSYGYTASADIEEVGPRFLRITDIVNGPIRWTDVPFCEIGETKRQSFLLKPNDVVVARTGATTGWARRIGRLKEEAVFASYLVRFRFENKIHPLIAATFMESDLYKLQIKARVGGAAQPNASAVVLGMPQLLIPSRSIQDAFTELVLNIVDEVDVLVEHSESLAAARDLLLPRLMNGTIPV